MFVLPLLMKVANLIRHYPYLFALCVNTFKVLLIYTERITNSSSKRFQMCTFEMHESLYLKARCDLPFPHAFTAVRHVFSI